MIRNFTPHNVCFEKEDGSTIVFESEGSIRMETTAKEVVSIDGFKTVCIDVDKEKTVTPAPENETFFIVSSMVREAFPERTDFISPATDPAFVIRDEKGFVKAVRAWVRTNFS